MGHFRWKPRPTGRVSEGRTWCMSSSLFGSIDSRVVNMTRIVNQHSSRSRAARKGVAAMEFVFVFSVFFMMVLGFLDLGVMLLRDQLLTDAAQRVAREAAVHGSLSEPSIERWGPVALSTNGNDPLINDVIAPSLTTMAADEILVNVQWTDGNNQPGSLVQVTLDYQHDAILPFLWSEDLLALQGSSIAHIAH